MGALPSVQTCASLLALACCSWTAHAISAVQTHGACKDQALVTGLRQERQHREPGWLDAGPAWGAAQATQLLCIVPAQAAQLLCIIPAQAAQLLCIAPAQAAQLLYIVPAQAMQLGGSVCLMPCREVGKVRESRQPGC